MALRPHSRIDHLAFERSAVWNCGPTPVVVGVTCIDKDIALLDERLAYFSLFCFPIGNDKLSSVSSNNLDLPLLSLLEPLGANDLMRCLDVLLQIELVSDPLQVLKNVFAARVKAGKVWIRNPSGRVGYLSFNLS